MVCLCIVAINLLSVMYFATFSPSFVVFYSQQGVKTEVPNFNVMNVSVFSFMFGVS